MRGGERRDDPPEMVADNCGVPWGIPGRDPSTDHRRVPLEAGGVMEFIYAPIHGFLVYLAQGWLLPFPVEPMMGSHGDHSILLQRGEL